MYLKRKLSDELTTFKSLSFPKKFQKVSKKKYLVTVGIGGNVGDVKRRFKHLAVKLKTDKRVDLLQTSLILKNPPFGYKDQGDFFNAVIVLKVNQQPKQFLDFLMRTEKRFGRKRTFFNAPRTLDLDIIFFDNRIIQTDQLTIPHAHWSKRESVIIPLAGLQ